MGCTMKEFDLGTGLTIEAPDRFETDTETHIWLPVKDAQNVARRLINMNAIFSYLPVPGDGCSRQGRHNPFRADLSLASRRS